MVGMKSASATAGGEIIEVEGGHIIRSTGRKDRHSKVYTAKGPRDRRVRLSAHTAIQFYDVQDRLGYDRPSKAVDWLIKKAQTAIDKLEELPPWHPVTTAASANPAEELAFDAESYNSFQLHRQLVETETENNNNNDSSSMMPNYCIDNSEAIAFFPKCASDQTSAMNFHSYQHGAVSRALNPAEDLCLSLQTVPNETGSALFPSPVGFDAGAGASAGWSVGRYQRMGAWNGGSEGFDFHAPPPPLVGQGSEFTPQRGALQSGNLFSSPPMRSWNDLSATSGGGAGAFGSSEFLGFRVPGRIRDDDGHGIGSDLKLPSSSN